MMKRIYLAVVFVVILILNTIWIALYSIWTLLERSYEIAYEYVYMESPWEYDDEDWKERF